MLPSIPDQLVSIAKRSLPQAEPRMPRTKEEKIADLKKRFGLTNHGKGKRKKRKGSRK